MNVFQSTKEFDDWLRGLKDSVAKARIFGRIDAATLGNFGECEAVGEGVSEMKIHVGLGYRIDCTRIGTSCLCIAGWW
jgi:putative addiction module killer protein